MASRMSLLALRSAGLALRTHPAKMAAVQTLARAPVALRMLHSTPVFASSVPAKIAQSSTLLPAPATAKKLQPAEEGYITKINLQMKAFDYAIADSYVVFVRRAANAFGITCTGRIALPTHIRRITILKSPHVYKKHRVQFEQRTHKRLLQLKNVTDKTANVFLEYIQLNMPPGIGLKIQKETIEPRGLP